MSARASLALSAIALVIGLLIGWSCRAYYNIKTGQLAHKTNMERITK